MSRVRIIAAHTHTQHNSQKDDRPYITCRPEFRSTMYYKKCAIQFWWWILFNSFRRDMEHLTVIHVCTFFDIINIRSFYGWVCTRVRGVSSLSLDISVLAENDDDDGGCCHWLRFRYGWSVNRCVVEWELERRERIRDRTYPRVKTPNWNLIYHLLFAYTHRSAWIATTAPAAGRPSEQK